MYDALPDQNLYGIMWQFWIVISIDVDYKCEVSCKYTVYIRNTQNLTKCEMGMADVNLVTFALHPTLKMLPQIQLNLRHISIIKFKPNNFTLALTNSDRIKQAKEFKYY